MKYDDVMRNDPQRRQACEKVLAARRAAFVRASGLMEAACTALSDPGLELGVAGDDPLMERVRDGVWKGVWAARNSRALLDCEPTETYVGNMAARGLPLSYAPAEPVLR